MNHELYFVIRYDGNLDRIRRVEAVETTIGRIQTNVLCLFDPAVSRSHAVLIQSPTGFVIRDLGSRNGTRLNGKLVVEAVLPVAAVVEIEPYYLKACCDLCPAQAEAGDAEDSTWNLPMFVFTNSERK